MVIPAKKGSSVAANRRATLSSGTRRMLLASIVSAATEEPKIKTARRFFIFTPRS